MSTHTFAVQPLERFAGASTALARPREITYFSYDEKRKLHLDTSSLRYYYPPELDNDLSQGFDTFGKHDDSIDEHLDGLLTAMIDLERRTGERCKADVVTWRGMITKFMTLPFDMRNGFEMNAVSFQDTIFIEEHHACKLSNRGRSNPRQDVMSFWGYKFETLATLPDVWDSQSRDTIESRNLEPVSNEAQFCSIVKTSFGPTKLIIGGEVDAVWDTHSSNPTYAELKTSKTPSTDKDRTTFARKLHRFWAQSFLLNVRKVIVGFRDDNGILRSFEEFETSDLPALAKKYAGRPLWDGKLSIEFAASLLAWIKDSINNDPGREGKVWRIRYRENSPVIEIFRVDGTVFLSDEFLKWRKGIDTAREE